MQEYSNNVADKFGNALSGVQVLVTKNGVNAALFAGNGVTPIANPTTTDNLGIFKFFAANGTYVITLTSSQLAAPIVYSGVILYDPVDLGAESALRSDLAASGGSALVGYLHSAGVVATTEQAAMRAEFCNVNLYFIAAEADATAMFNRATAAARRVYVPAGTYAVDAANFPSNTEIMGDGDSTIITQPLLSSRIFTCDSGSSLVTNNIINLRMSNLQLRGTSDTNLFSQFVHLVSLNGVSNVVFKHVLFKGFRGDGAYIGSGNTAGLERHNENVTFKRCRFDGINKENRNAISFIDINGCLVEGCEFTNCTKSTMPGAIDFEPDAQTFPIIKNITIRSNKFKNIGGNVGVIGLLLPVTTTETVQNFRIADNKAESFNTFFALQTYRAPTSTSVDNNILLEGNTTKSGTKMFEIYDGKRITLRDNTSSDMLSGDFLGFSATGTQLVRDVSLEGNRFTRHNTTSSGGSGLNIYKADFVDFIRNKWIDCGTGSAGTSNAILFNTGASSNITFDGNEISAPTAKTLVGIQISGHTFTASTNKFFRNNFNGLANNFPSEQSDTVETTYSPVVAGSTTAGAGTYTVQYGRFRREGNLVFVRGYLSVAAGHTGTGGIQISLPLNAKQVSNGERYPLNVSMSGVATTGGHTGLLAAASVAGGVTGCLLVAQQQTGSQATVAVPAGAFLAHFSGVYEAA